MNEYAANDNTNQPATLKNEATLDANIFSTTASGTASAAASAAAASAANTIAPDTHFLSSGLKKDTEIFSKGNINNIDDKDRIYTNPDPDKTDADTPDATAKDSGSSDYNSQYSLRNHKLDPYSTNTKKN